MKLFYPLTLNFLWLVVALGVFLFFLARRRRHKMTKFVQESLLDQMAANYSHRRYLIKQVLILLVFVFSIVALARPQWGFEWQEIKRQGLDVLLVIDTSKSMLADDVKPNRLERTKLAVKDLLKRLKGDRIGLVAFSGKAFLVCPLTVDYKGFLLSLNDLDVNIIPRGGTNLGEALQEALRGYENAPNQYKAVVVITDGDNLEGEPLKWAEKAKKEGVKIYTVGIGTPNGELIRIRNARGQYEFLKDENGDVVKSRLNESLLQEIAAAGDGVYVRSSGAQFGLDFLYERFLSKLEKREIDAQMEKRFHERFQWPMFIAFSFLMIDSFITTRRDDENE